MTIIAPGSYVEYAGKRQLVAAVLTNGGERYYMLLYPKHGVTSLVPADILESPGLETPPEHVAETKRTVFRGPDDEPCLNCGKKYAAHITVDQFGTYDVCPHGPL